MMDIFYAVALDTLRLFLKKCTVSADFLRIFSKRVLHFGLRFAIIVQLC